MVGHHCAVACKNPLVYTIHSRVIQKLIIPTDQRRGKPLQMMGLSLGLRLQEQLDVEPWAVADTSAVRRKRKGA